MSVCFKLKYLDIWICWKTHLMRNNYFDTGFPNFCWSFLDMKISSDSYVDELDRFHRDVDESDTSGWYME